MSKKEELSLSLSFQSTRQTGKSIGKKELSHLLAARKHNLHMRVLGDSRSGFTLEALPGTSVSPWIRAAISVLDVLQPQKITSLEGSVHFFL